MISHEYIFFYNMFGFVETRGSSVSRASPRLSAGRRFESGMIHQYLFAMFPYFTQYLACKTSSNIDGIII